MSKDDDASGAANTGPLGAEQAALGLVESLERRRKDEDDDYLALSAEDDYVDRLRNAAMSLLEAPTEVRPGDVVVWKPGLRNRRFPGEVSPAVVVEVTEPTPPQLDPDAADSREPLDLGLGVITTRGRFYVFYFDRRRFQLWDEDR
jgi:hypothetical protein